MLRNPWVCVGVGILIGMFVVPWARTALSGMGKGSAGA